MIQRTVKEVNKNAKLHHATLQGKLLVQIFPEPSSNETQEINNNNEKLALDERKNDLNMSTPETIRLGMDSDEKLFENITVTPQRKYIYHTNH